MALNGEAAANANGASGVPVAGTATEQVAPTEPFERAMAQLQPTVDGCADGTVNRRAMLAAATAVARQHGVNTTDLRGWATDQIKKMQVKTGGGGGALAATVVNPNAAVSSIPLGLPITQMPTLMTEAQAHEYLNAILFKACDWGGRPYFGRRKIDGSALPMRAEDIPILLSGHFVSVPDDKGGTRTVPAATWWVQNPSKVVFDVVRYDPESKLARPSEVVLNMWAGFAVQPVRGSWKKMCQHIWKILCRRDRRAFKYLIRWLAHLVQCPGTNPGVMVVIRSNREGVGKSSLGQWMLAMLGRHGVEIADAEQVFGSFNDALANVSVVLLEEPVFPGDHRAAGMLKAMLTAHTLRINPKGRPAYDVPHNIHFLMTTNGQWAVPAGAEARRFLMLDASDDIMPRRYFDELWAEAEGGGIAAMLCGLLKVDLRGFNPRDVPATAALVEQQRRSADDIAQWITDAVLNGELVPGAQGGGFMQTVTSAQLHAAYLAWTDAQGIRRPKTAREFGRALSELGLVRGAGNNPPKWTVPSRQALLAASDHRAGIRKVLR